VAAAVADHAYDVARRYRPWLLPRWDDFSGQILERLFRARADKKLREDETLFSLARRLVKAEGDKEVGEVKKGSAALSFDDDRPGAVPRDILEETATLSSRPRFKNPEQAVAARELRDWLFSAAGALSPTDLDTFAHEWARCHGEYQTLAEALGIDDGAARQRLLRLRRELAAYAEATGSLDLAEQLDSRMRGRPAPTLLTPTERATRPGHRLEELTRYRAGDLGAAEAADLEKHLPDCGECLRSLRALDVTRDAFGAALVAPMGPWDPERVVAELQRKYPRRAGSRSWQWFAIALLAAVVAAALWLLRTHPNQVPTRPHLESAPIPPPEETDGGR
jgi:hypothetical protein